MLVACLEIAPAGAVAFMIAFEPLLKAASSGSVFERIGSNPPVPTQVVAAIHLGIAALHRDDGTASAFAGSRAS